MDAPVGTAPAPLARLQQRRRVWLAALALALLLIALVVLAVVAAVRALLREHRRCLRGGRSGERHVAGERHGRGHRRRRGPIACSPDRSSSGSTTPMRASRCRTPSSSWRAPCARHARVFASRDQLLAVVAQRRADLARAQSDFDRRSSLAQRGAVSGEELGHARDALQRGARCADGRAEEPRRRASRSSGVPGRRQPRRGSGGHAGGARLAQRWCAPAYEPR